MSTTEPLNLDPFWNRSNTYMALWDAVGNTPTSEQVAAAVATAEDVRELLTEVERLQGANEHLMPNRLARLAARLHAEILGYFWLPCPLCGEDFGGHEWREVAGLSSHIPTDEPYRFRGICPNCTKAGKGKREDEIYEQWAARTAQPSPDLPDSLQRQTKPAGEDVYQAVQQASISASLREAMGLDGPSPLRAAVDEAVRLTEQRIRDQMREEQTEQLLEANATIGRAMDALGLDHPVWLLLDDYDGSMDNVKALVAETEQRIRAELRDAIPVPEVSREEIIRLCDEQEARQQVVQAARDWVRLGADEPALTLAAGLDRIREAVRGLEETEGAAPLSAPSATESADGVSNVDEAGSEGQRGSEGRLLRNICTEGICRTS